MKGASLLKQVFWLLSIHCIKYHNFSYLLKFKKTKEFSLCILSMAYVKLNFHNLFSFLPFTPHLTCGVVFSLSQIVWTQGLWFLWSPWKHWQCIWALTIFLVIHVSSAKWTVSNKLKIQSAEASILKWRAFFSFIHLKYK